MTASMKAAELKAELFLLVGKFKDLSAQIQANETADFDARFEASSQADTAACALAAVYQQIGEIDIFVDAHRDTPEFAFPV